jgi:hypothetical protein
MVRKSTVLLSVAVISSASWAAWLWHELRDERARNAALVARLEERTANEAHEPRAQSPRPPVVPAAAGARPAGIPDAVATSGLPREMPGHREDWATYQQRLLQDPRFREARRAQERLAYAPRRANFIRLLGMSPEQADTIIDLGLDHEALMQEAANNQAHDGETHDEKQARLDALESEYQDKLRTLLGEGKRAQLESYMESRGSRMQVDRLRSELTEANALRDDQVEPLIAALHTERSQMQSDLEAYRASLEWNGDATETWRRLSEREGQLLKDMNSRMHSSAARILSGSQLEALDGMLTRELQRFDAQQRLIRIQSKLDQVNPQPASPD